MDASDPPDPTGDPPEEQATVDAIVAEVLAVSSTAAPDGDPPTARPTDALAGFSRALLRRVAAAELAMTDPEQVAESIVGAFDLLAGRAPGTVAVQVVPVPSSMFSPEGGLTAIDVASDDRPLLFSTVLAALSRTGLTVGRFTHPIVGVERGDSGRVVSIDPHPGATGPEVIIHVEVAEVLDREARHAVVEEIERAIGDLVATEADGPAMQSLVESVAGRLDSRGAGLYEAEASTTTAFCRWLLSGNFLLAGVRHEPDDRSLGLLRVHPDLPLVPGDPGEFLTEAPIVVRRSLVTSRIIRPERLAELVIADVDDDGRRVGTVRALGLTTLRGRSERPSGTPWVKDKLAAALQHERVVPGSHDETILRALFDGLPWDVLLLSDPVWMRDTLLELIQAHQSGRTCVRLLPEPASDAITLLVAVPQEQVGSELAGEVQDLLVEVLQPESVESQTELSSSGMTMLSYVACLTPGAVDDIDGTALTAAIVEACRPWSERLARELSAAAGRRGGEVAQRWLGRVPPQYREATPPATAAVDLLDLDRLDGTGEVSLRLVDEGVEGWHHLRIAVGGPPLGLSRFLPVLESIGLVVAEEMTFALEGPRAHPSGHASPGGPASVLDLLVARRDGSGMGGGGQSRLAAAVLAMWDGRTDVDRLNELVLTAGLDWDHVSVLRAYARYLAQVATGTRAETLFDALADNPTVAAALWHRFERRFRPATPDDTTPAGWDESSRDRVLGRCDDVVRLDQDRSLRRLLALVDATVRTNVWARERSDAVVLSFDGVDLPQPHPVTWREIWVSATDVEGIHLRAGPVARGGLRWSDRDGDVRVEVLQLMQAQAMKNALIVPTGAKGGFVLRHRPDDPAAVAVAVRSAYSTFVRSLLDITDDRRDGTPRRPPGVRAADGPDAYLVVAADRGTATFSDLANSFSHGRRFWLDDAFASGGSDGYDHKALGVTARGAWVSVTEHFELLDVDVTCGPFSVVGVGDMSGDVFGNGMLLSHSLCLVAAFDHRHVFLDPHPDPERSWTERRRLFDLPRSSWADYDPDVLGPGGMIVPRTAKHVRPSTEVRALLGIEDVPVALPDLIRAVLRAPADLLYFGGIGTYVKASDESNGAVGDPANDEFRIDAGDLSVRVVAEGANLAMTPAARVQYARLGGLVNSDAIDNSAGVDSSDHEVNLKILLALPERAGTIERGERNDLLESVVDDVVGHVLGNVAKQNRALTRGAAESQRSLEAYLALLFSLEASGSVDRDIHALPSGVEVRARRDRGDGLYRPELAVLLAATKEWLAAEILASDLPERAPLQELMERYFPPVLSGRFAEALREHPLQREIIASRLANEIVDRMGAPWVPELARRSGQPASVVAAAYWMARATARIGPWWSAIDRAPRGDRDLLWDPAAQVVTALAGDYLRRGVARSWRWSEIARNVDAAAVLARWRPDGTTGADATRPGDDPGARADKLRLLGLAPGLAEVAQSAGRTPDQAVGAFVEAGRRFGLDKLTWAVLACRLDPADTWSQRHRESLLFDLDRIRRAATGVLLRGSDLSDLSARLDQLEPRMEEAAQAGTDRLDSLAVVSSELWLVVEEEAGGIPRA